MSPLNPTIGPVTLDQLLGHGREGCADVGDRKNFISIAFSIFGLHYYLMMAQNSAIAATTDMSKKAEDRLRDPAL